MTRKILRISLKPEQNDLLEKLMADVHQTNKSAFIVYLLANEEKARENVIVKRAVGRPKKEEEETIYYPAPYEGGAPYDKPAFEAYYAFRKQPLPDPMPKPLTKEELQKWDL